MHPPSLSVIVPNFNNAKYLHECINSVLQQSYEDFDLIIIDDCSTDESRTIIQRYAEEDHRVRPVFNSANMGVSHTRHIGILTSDSQLITTLDSDDIYSSKDKLKKEMEILSRAENPEKTCAFSGIEIIDQHSVPLKHQPKAEIVEGDIFKNIFARDCFIPRDFIFSKQAYLDCGAYDFKYKLYEDWDLKIRLARMCSFIYSGHKGIGYRRIGEGLSAATLDQHINALISIEKKNSIYLDDTNYQYVKKALSAFILKLKTEHLQANRELIRQAVSRRLFTKVLLHYFHRLLFKYRTKNYS